MQRLYLYLIASVYECRLSEENRVIFFYSSESAHMLPLEIVSVFSSTHRSAAASLPRCENPCITNTLHSLHAP